jgi:hypothetical protein
MQNIGGNYAHQRQHRISLFDRKYILLQRTLAGHLGLSQVEIVDSLKLGVRIQDPEVRKGCPYASFQLLAPDF